MATETKVKRIDTLSKPKSLPDGFIEDKRSLYWDCKIAKDWSKPQSTTAPNLSPRLEQLILSKTLPKEYVGDKPNPIWQVSPAAMKASPTGRLESLSQSKEFHKDYEPPKSVFSNVSNGAKSASASQRVEVLSRAKDSAALPTNQSLWDWSVWEPSVTDTAKGASPSDEVLRLSLPKRTHSGYKECRGVQWTISGKTLKALPSLRVQQLARPKSRSQFVDHHDENAYKVSSAAKYAQATPRMQELCEPLPRKVKQKKGT